MDEKKYKKLVTIIVILLSIILLMAGYIVYDVVTSSNNNASKVNNYEEKTEKDYDLAKAKQLLDNIDYNNFFSMAEDSRRIEALKIQIAFNKTKSKTATCDSIYSDLPNVKKSDYGYDVPLDEKNGDQTWCHNSTKVISYNDINDTYQRLFGSSKIIPKKDFGYSYCDGTYDYIENLDAFVHLYYEPDGCYSLVHEVNVIKTAKIKGEKLTIEVAGVILERKGDDYVLKTGDKKVTFKFSEVGEESFDKEIFNKYSKYMQNYRFVFELEGNNYIFKDVSKY